MFDFVFNLFGAYNQVGFFIGILVCLLLGGLLVANDIHWRLHAERVKGTVIGVRCKQGGLFNPVYRIMFASGKTADVTSNIGSGGIKGKETGTVVDLLAFESDQYPSTRSANSWVQLVAGLIILVPVPFLFKGAMSYPVTGFTWIMLAAMGVFIATRIQKLIIPAAQRKPVSEWRAAMKAQYVSGLEKNPVVPIEDYFKTAEGIKAQKLQRNTAKFIAPVLLLAACGAFYGGYIHYNKVALLDKHGLRVEGLVIAMKEKESRHDGRTSHTWAPVVQFKAVDGSMHTFTDGISSNPPSYHTGDDVKVMYLESAPDVNVSIDRGWVNMAIPLGVMGFSCLLFLVGLSSLKAAFRSQTL